MNHFFYDIPVLMYHALEDSKHPAGAKDAGEQLYVVSRDTFHAQMEYLSRNGFIVLLLDDLLQMPEWPRKGIVLTFDDGHQSNYTIALPILEEFGFKAHFFITTGWLDTPDFLTSSQVQKLVEKGMVIGSHGVSHSFFSDMEAKQIQEELEQSQKILEQCSLSPTKSFSAPGGRVQSNVISLGKKIGYELFCTSEFALLTQALLPESIPRLAVQENMDIATFQKMVHGDKQFMRKYKVKNFVLSCLKRIFGNSTYEKLRGITLQIKTR